MQTIVSTVAALLFIVPPGDAPARAYLSAWRGDLAEARTIAASVLSEAPSDPGALFVAAGVEIEEWNLDAADALVTRLERVEPRPPEAGIFRALVERRRRSPSERMEDSLGEAWKAAGRPDLSTAGVLTRLRMRIPRDARVLPGVTSGALNRLAPADAFLVRVLHNPLFRDWEETKAKATVEWRKLFETNARWKDAWAKEALVLSREPGSNSVGLNLCLYRALDDPDAKRRVGAALLRALPDDGYVALALALDGTSENSALTSGELDAVEAATRKAGFAWPLRAAFRDVVGVARRLDPVHAELLAREAFGYCVPPSVSPLTLERRATATKDPLLRARAGRAVDAVGRRLGESASMLDRMMGFVLRGSAAEISGDPERKAMLERAQQWRHRLDEVSRAAAVHTWPLPSTWRQWDPEGEVSYLERLAE